MGRLTVRLGATECQSVRAYSLEVTWAAFCGTLGALGAHPRADEPYAVLGKCHHAASLAPRGPRIRGKIGSVRCLTPPMPTDDAASRSGRNRSPAALPFNVIEVAPAGPTITLGQLGYDHALVVVRGELCVEFLRSVRQHLTSLVEAGVRYVVVDLAEVTACPPRWWASSRQRVGRYMPGRAGCD